MTPLCIVSARWNSSRFPGKPLTMINGREMILWVAASCKAAVGVGNMFITTEDDRIADRVSREGYKVIRLRSPNTCCADQTAEAIRSIDCDIIIDVQSDEPLIRPEDIHAVIDWKRQKHEYVINAYAHEKDGDRDSTVKILSHYGINSDLIIASRLPIPYGARIFKRQIGIYGYYKEQLLRLYGYNKPKSVNEKMEGVHVLRCVDNHQKVFMIKLDGKYQSVDLPEDVEKVETIINDS